MILLFFIGMRSNPTFEYNFYENIYLYFLFLINLFNVLAGTTPSLLRSHNVKKILWPVDKTYDKSHRLHAMHYNIDLVVKMTSSVYCDQKKKQQKTSKLTNKTSNFQTKKANKKKKRKETKNKQKNSHRIRTLDLSMSSPWRNPSATQVQILNQQFKYIYDQI